MARQREDRYQSMKDLAVALTEYLKHAQKAPAQPAAKQPPQKAADHDSMEQAFANIAASGIRTARRPSPKPLAQRLQQLAPLTRRHRNLLISIAAAMLFFVLWGIIVSLRTPDGTLVVEIDDPDAKVQILSDEGKILLEGKGKDGQVVFSLDPGKRRVRVEKDGEEVFAQDVTIVSGEKREVRAWWEPTAIPVKQPAVADSSCLPARAIAPFNAEQAKLLQGTWAYLSGVPVEKEVILPSGEKLMMVLIPPGEFMMGTSDKRFDALVSDHDKQKWMGPRRIKAIECERPQHRVRITEPYYLAMHETTVGQFRAFVEDSGYTTQARSAGEGLTWRNQEFRQTDDHPVVQVSWSDAKAFCDWLAEKTGMACDLPTEAQWEYACRSGSTTLWCFGDDEVELEKYAWFGNAPKSGTNPVGQKLPNSFGLFDMHGNAYEWCSDLYAEGFYADSPINDPVGPPSGDRHVFRGGAFLSHPWLTRSANRGFLNKLHSLIGQRDTGFRVACKISKQPAENAVLPPLAPSGNVTIPADWQTWSHSLATPDALDSFYCTSGLYGPYGKWMLAEVVEGAGIKINDGFTQTGLWAPVSVGSSYRVSLEAMQDDEFRDSRVRLLLGGPGYGNNTETSYCVLVKEKDAVLMREGIECCSASLPSPKVPGRWFQLEAQVERGDIRVLFDGVPILQYTDSQPLTGALHRWVGFVGRGATWYRNLQISSPQLDAKAERELLPPLSDPPLPNGSIIYELAMEETSLAKDWWLSWPEAVNINDGSLDLRDPNAVSLLLLKRPLHGDVAMEAEIEYPTAETLNFQMAFWAADRLPESPADRVGGWFVWLPTPTRPPRCIGMIKQQDLTVWASPSPFR